jgi:large subunit ribosomal protein L2
MGKRIIQQARGHGSLSYQVRKYAYRFRVGYPQLGIEGKAKIIDLVDSPAHTAPLAKIMINGKIFYNVAFERAFIGQELSIGKAEKDGDIAKLDLIPSGSKIFNIENFPGDGGKFVRSSGSYATLLVKEKEASVMLPSGKAVKLNKECRATIGIISGAGRKEKPFVKAGNRHFLMKSKNKLWPRTSAVKMNVVDHPFGSGRGKNLSHGRKGKIAKRNAPAGARVGMLRPRRSGRRKR